jgi:hypothetical protein
VEKEYNAKHVGIVTALEKADEHYKKEVEKLVLRKEDLDKQLESMMEKLRVSVCWRFDHSPIDIMSCRSA